MIYKTHLNIQLYYISSTSITMINTTWLISQEQNYISTFIRISNVTGDQIESLSNESSPITTNGSDVINVAAVPMNNFQQNLTLYGYIFLFLVGYFGHINSIIIFLRPTLRTISTSFLFICVAISDTMYLLTRIYDFLYIGIGLSPINSQTNPNLSNALCRFRSFIQSLAMCSSAWFLLAISIDRWLRIRFPFQVKRLCTRKHALFGVLIILICAITLNSHLLLPSLGTLAGSNICGPISSQTYSFFFRQVFLYLCDIKKTKKEFICTY